MEENKQQEEDQVLDYTETALTETVANLAQALNSLTEIDSSLLGNDRKEKLKIMKQLVFDSLFFYCECLPQPID